MLGILLEAERDELIKEVATLTMARPDALIPLLSREHVIRIKTNSIPRDYAYDVVRYCEMSAWVEDPALIIKLLKHWEMYKVFSEAIARLKGETPKKFYVEGRVWDACLLGELPFLNRLKTRKALEHFTYPLEPAANDPYGMRVLIVNGPTNSGKSFTYEYIMYLGSIFAELNFTSVWIDYKKHINSRFGPLDLADNLLDQINPNWEDEGIELPNPDLQRPERLKIQILQLIFNQIDIANRKKRTSQRYYIVLDGFDAIDIPEETHELIQMFASVATGALFSAESGDNLRLVLLGYNRPITNYQSRVENEDILPLKRDDIQIYFKRYASISGVEADENLINALTDIVESIATDPEKRTEHMAKMALRAAHRAFNL